MTPWRNGRKRRHPGFAFLAFLATLDPPVRALSGLCGAFTGRVGSLPHLNSKSGRHQIPDKPPLLAGHNSPGDCCGFHRQCGSLSDVTGNNSTGDRPQGRWRGSSRTAEQIENQLTLKGYHTFSPIKCAERACRFRCAPRRMTESRPVRFAQPGFFSGGFEREILEQEKAQGSSHPCAAHTGRQRRPGKGGKTEAFRIACAKRTKGLLLVKSHCLCVTQTRKSPSFRGLSG